MGHAPPFLRGADINLVFITRVKSRSASLPHSSYIDYFAVSETILKDIVDFDIIDSGVNLSDYNPISLTIDLGISFSRCGNTSVRKPTCPQKASTLRLDHANLSDYYELLSAPNI